MKSKENILKYETRREIYSFIVNNPGLHLREIERRMKYPLGSIRYHLDSLKKYGLITSKVAKRYTRFYATDKLGRKEKEIIDLLRQEIPRKIILLLLTPGPGNIYRNKDTMYNASLDHTTFLRTYSKKEFVELTKFWSGGILEEYYLKKSRSTIDFHLNKLLEADLIEKIKVGKEMKYKLRDDDVTWWTFLIRYKNALSNDLIDHHLKMNDSLVKYFVDRFTDVFYDIFPHPYHV
ncbi:MAG: ArsR family transcriptional regulator [Thermoplasmatales archaeon]|nr:ArsR family transcriptional regulator [Thermoplasmatales archaeon]